MLNKEIAQKIVDKMMAVVPYNINIMDNDAVIIGSGDADRIGTLHYGAAEALSKKDDVSIYKEDEFVKMGVNVPILFKDEIAGVIGITGSPSEVGNFTKLIKVTAELLLSEQHELKNRLMMQRVKQEFLYEWIYTREEYSNDIILRAKSLNIDILKKRVVVIIHHRDNRRIMYNIKTLLPIDEYVVPVSNDKLALILNYNSSYINEIEKINKKFSWHDIKIGIGNFHKIINESMSEAMQAVSIGSKLFKEEKIIHYNRIKFYCNNLLEANEDILNDIKTKIEEYKGGDELLETVMKYIELNGEKNRIAEELHIHRNTLNYRLNIIEKITELNLNSYMDIYILITLYLVTRIKE